MNQEIRQAGYTIVNVDMTLIAETPKISPHIPAMREIIAERLSLFGTQVGIKATTHEGIGALGAGMGMAAHAVAALAPL